MALIKMMLITTTDCDEYNDIFRFPFIGINFDILFQAKSKSHNLNSHFI